MNLSFNQKTLTELSVLFPLPQSFIKEHLVLFVGTPICLSLYTQLENKTTNTNPTDNNNSPVVLNFYFLIEDNWTTTFSIDPESIFILPSTIAYYILVAFANFYLDFVPQDISIVGGKIEILATDKTNTIDLRLNESQDLIKSLQPKLSMDFDFTFLPSLKGRGFFGAIPGSTKFTYSFSNFYIQGDSDVRLQPFIQVVQENSNTTLLHFAFTQLFLMALTNVPTLSLNLLNNDIARSCNLLNQLSIENFNDFSKTENMFCNLNLQPLVWPLLHSSKPLLVKYANFEVQFNPWDEISKKLNLPIYGSMHETYNMPLVALEMNSAFFAPGLYIIRNKHNGKFYIGETKCLSSRLGDHYTNLVENKDIVSMKPLHDDFVKQGSNITDFEFFILPNLPDYKLPGTRKKFETDIIKSNPELCYNHRSDISPVVTNLCNIPNFNFDSYNQVETTFNLRNVRNLDRSNSDKENIVYNRFIERFSQLRAPVDKAIQLNNIFRKALNNLETVERNEILSAIIIVYLVEKILTYQSIMQSVPESNVLNVINTKVWNWETDSYNFGAYSLRGFLLKGKPIGEDYLSKITFSLTAKQFDALNPNGFNFNKILERFNNFYTVNNLIIKDSPNQV